MGGDLSWGPTTGGSAGLDGCTRIGDAWHRMRGTEPAQGLARIGAAGLHGWRADQRDRIRGTRIGAGGPGGAGLDGWHGRDTRTNWGPVARVAPDGWHADRSWGPWCRMGGAADTESAAEPRHTEHREHRGPTHRALGPDTDRATESAGATQSAGPGTETAGARHREREERTAGPQHRE